MRLSISTVGTAALLQLYLLQAASGFDPIFRPLPSRHSTPGTSHHSPARPPSTTSRGRWPSATELHSNLNGNTPEGESAKEKVLSTIFSNQSRSITFSALMGLSGAVLGPFLDSYHSNFGVLQYNTPFESILWGSPEHPALVTCWWVPPLFALAGFLIGWLYLILDAANETVPSTRAPSPPTILIGISIFTLQYWLSGVMHSQGVDRTTILNVMSMVATVSFAGLDASMAGFWTSAATAIGGPLIEAGLLLLSRNELFWNGSGYHYTDLGETGFFPLWIAPVYFLGGPAVGNLARGIWNALPAEENGVGTKEPVVKERPRCKECDDTRCVPCPNCEGAGTYVAMGGRSVICSSCRGRGFVVCRICFSEYNDDPNDIDAIRELMSKMPD